MNNQIPLKRSINQNGAIRIHSMFPTIQGEGPFTGHPAIFIRLYGCNLQCPLCDTQYTDNEQLLDAVNVVINVEKMHEQSKLKNKLIVITGGEPFRQNIVPVTEILNNLGYYVQVETNGTLPIPEYFQHNKDMTAIVCSPKTSKIHPTTLIHASCFKYVLSAQSCNKDDGLPLQALGHAATPYIARPTHNQPIYVQPLDEKDETLNKLNLQATIKSCMEYGYILQLQTHKIINME